MKPPVQAVQNQERCIGPIERVVFHNPDNGFSVLRLKVRGHRDLVTMIGNAASVTPGELIEAQGQWFQDRKHGLQFKASHIKVVPPSTKEGMQKYLASGMVKGIGPHFAKVLMAEFGESVFDVIENEPQRLLSLPGIGKVRHERIITAWAEQKAVRAIMVFLQSHGVGTARAVRIYKTYGDKSVEKIQENPYRLALDIHGIGFKTADELAQRLGISKDAVIRAQAGLRHVLQEQANRGHCAVKREELVSLSSELLSIDENILQSAIVDELQVDNIVSEQLEGEEIIFLAGLQRAEDNVAKHIIRLQKNVRCWADIDAERALPWVEEKTKLQLSNSQKQAVATAINSKVTIITGGPGVGKTTVVNSILKILRGKQVRVTLCAPTGRAAKRLTETTHIPAKTIHRLLGRGNKGGFQHNQDNPLDTELLVVDESSMIDIVLMHSLLKALPDKASLLLVGDVDQLPSVGPGSVLNDLIQSSVIPTIRLTEIFRQAANSQIITNAHRINEGEMPRWSEDNPNSDFYVLPCEEPEEILSKLITVVTKRIPQRFKVNPITDIQVLSPMNRGILGAKNLNLVLQEKLNPNPAAKVQRFGWTYAVGDKVIQTINNYDKDVFNGDIGTVVRVDTDDSLVVIEFEGRRLEYDVNELDEVSLAYAVTIHKSQGSEYPVVVIPIATQHFTLLERNLIYTAVTRGKQLVVIVGQKKALGMAVRNQKAGKRLTKLSQRLINQEEK